MPKQRPRPLLRVTSTITSASPKIPIIGLAGGIGAGKSFYARLLASLGCLVFDADAIVADLYCDPAVLQTLRSWWGDDIVSPDGTLHRKALADRIFADPAARHRLEAYIHPLVIRRRDELMAKATQSSTPPRAVVWDIPLLFETGMNDQCDAVLFIDTPESVRLARAAARGWTPDHLRSRTLAQTPLATKAAKSHYTLDGQSDAPSAMKNLTDILSQVLQKRAK